MAYLNQAYSNKAARWETALSYSDNLLRTSVSTLPVHTKIVLYKFMGLQLRRKQWSSKNLPAIGVWWHGEFRLEVFTTMSLAIAAHTEVTKSKIMLVVPTDDIFILIC